MPSTRAAVERVLDLTDAIIPTAASLLIVLSGVVLLASVATPMQPARAAAIASVFPLPIIEASHLLGGLVASALIVLAPALQRRLSAAYRLALVCLLLGVIISLTKGLDYEEATVLTIVALLLLPYRQEFFQRTSLLDQPLTPEWIVAIVGILGAAVWLMLFAYKHVEYDHSLWLQFALKGDAPRSLRALLAAALAICGYALLSLPRSSRCLTVASENDTAAPKDRADAGLD